MRRFLIVVLSLGLVAWLFLFRVPAVSNASISSDEEAIATGEYLVHAAGCISCHIDSGGTDALSGGQPLHSPFGTFYVPNITPHEETGIGGWTGEDFLLALKHGRSPDGSFYYPALPYRSYQGMTDEDVLDIAAYLMSQPAVESTTPAHELSNGIQRWMLAFWNRLADMQQPAPEGFADPVIARGAYLARNLGHCGECHTPRTGLGISSYGEEFSGAPLMDGEADDISAAALEEWSEEDFAFFLFLGIKPDGEFVGGEMEPVIEHNTSPLTEEDRAALAAFFVRGQGS